jgi:hypothetical protein
MCFARPLVFGSPMGDARVVIGGWPHSFNCPGLHPGHPFPAEPAEGGGRSEAADCSRDGWEPRLPRSRGRSMKQGMDAGEES